MSRVSYASAVGSIVYNMV